MTPIPTNGGFPVKTHPVKTQGDCYYGRQVQCFAKETHQQPALDEPRSVKKAIPYHLGSLTLTNGAGFFTDPQTTNLTHRFYHAAQ